VIGLHDAFGIDIPEADYPALATLAGCVRYVTAHAAPPPARPRLPHRFEAVIDWRRGDDGAAALNHSVTFGDRPPLTLSAPPQFKGDATRLSPEELFVASVGSCQLLTYLALAARAGLPVTRYEDRPVGTLALSESRKKHYSRASSRYQGATDLRIDAAPLPAHLRHEVGYPEVWHVDLVEWEQRGSASEACGDIILDLAWTEVTRRRAILGRLTALALEEHLASSSPPEATLTMNLAVALADQLSQVELYSILSPLEHLARRPEPTVRTAVDKGSDSHDEPLFDGHTESRNYRA
jgi:organic hydroperoxide reductase OsmC/OhrA